MKKSLIILFIILSFFLMSCPAPPEVITKFLDITIGVSGELYQETVELWDGSIGTYGSKAKVEWIEINGRQLTPATTAYLVSVEVSEEVEWVPFTVTYIPYDDDNNPLASESFENAVYTYGDKYLAVFGHFSQNHSSMSEMNSSMTENGLSPFEDPIGTSGGEGSDEGIIGTTWVGSYVYQGVLPVTETLAFTSSSSGTSTVKPEGYAPISETFSYTYNPATNTGELTIDYTLPFTITGNDLIFNNLTYDKQ